MADVIVCSDAPWVLDEVSAVLSGPGDHLRQLTSGEMVLPAALLRKPDLAVLDMQVGNMGAMASAMELRLEESGGRLQHVPVLFLLDRRADVFLARRAEADGWVIKPLDPIRLGKAIRTILGGGRYEDDSYRPLTVAGLVATGPEHD
ncbi:MAG: PleD family two-component system response regulator [Acidimicrobiales bacterium]